MDNLRVTPLKVAFVGHLTLSTWAMSTQWVPQSYLYYNSFFLACLLWALMKTDSTDPVVMALLINGIGIVMDIIILSTAFPYEKAIAESSRRLPILRFSVTMCCINLICRPLSSIVIYRTMQERTGNYSTFGNFGGTFRGPGETYENIDQPVPTVSSTGISPQPSPAKNPYQGP